MTCLAALSPEPGIFFFGFVAGCAFAVFMCGLFWLSEENKRLKAELDAKRKSGGDE